MKNIKNLDQAFANFQREIMAMEPDQFWSLLGTSIDELNTKQLLDEFQYMSENRMIKVQSSHQSDYYMRTNADLACA